MKYLAIGFLSIASCISVKAQVEFGAKVGANFSTLTGSDVHNANTKVGFQGGVLADVQLAGSFWLQPEVNFSMQGAKVESGGNEYTLRHNYLNVPLLLKYKDESGLFAETGPQLGVLLTAKASANGLTSDVKSSFKSTDFSWAFGVGYLVKEINAGIDVRYNLGLTNIEANGSGTNGTMKNSVFQVGVFYLFAKGK